MKVKGWGGSAEEGHQSSELSISAKIRIVSGAGDETLSAIYALFLATKHIRLKHPVLGYDESGKKILSYDPKNDKINATPEVFDALGSIQYIYDYEMKHEQST